MRKVPTDFTGQRTGYASNDRSRVATTSDRGDADRRAGKKARILIIEDEPAMVAGLRDNFEYEGYDVISADDGVSGLERVFADDPDLVVLDVMMPRMSGLEVCKQVKARRPSVPIIMLTARGQEIDKVVGLELGADDYVTKPFSIRELMARVKAVLRRTSLQVSAPAVYRFGDVEVNVRGNEVRRAGRPVELSAKEFALLAYFISHPSETLSGDHLLDAVWGYENYPNTRTVDTHIVHLRQKLEPNRHFNSTATSLRFDRRRLLRVFHRSFRSRDDALFGSS
jgi:DNA-binding response OmpR family regulator